MNPRPSRFVILFPVLITPTILLLAVPAAPFSLSWLLVPAGVILACGSASLAATAASSFQRIVTGAFLGFRLYLHRNAAFPKIATQHFRWMGHCKDSHAWLRTVMTIIMPGAALVHDTHVSSFRRSVECCGRVENALPA